MIEQLFGSKTRVKLLQLFYGNPNRSFYVREITRKIDEQINSVRRELANLLSVGIITSDATDNKLYYEVSQEYEYYRPLAMIFGGMSKDAPGPAKKAASPTSKTAAKEKSKEEAPVEAATGHPIAKAIRGIGRVDLVLLTGQFTRDEQSGVDILIVGDVNATKVEHFMEELEKTENKELRYVVMSLDNYNYRVQINDRFISNLLSAKKQVIINHQNLELDR